MNLLGWRLSIDPAPVIFYAPTKTLGRGISKFRLEPMIESVKALKDGLKGGHDDTIFEKIINGQRCGIGWLGSKAQARSYSAPLILIDERDAIPQITAEGDVVDVANARSASYPDRMCVVTSSPLKGSIRSAVREDTGLEHWVVNPDDEIESPTWLLWQKGTRHEWAWPCVHCETFFVPRLRLLRWGNTEDPNEAADNAHMICPSCEEKIYYSSVATMNLDGVHVAPGQRVVKGAVVGEEAPNLIFSSWVSGLVSNWIDWAERAHNYVNAKIDERRTPGALQAFMNVEGGELYQKDKQTISDVGIKACMADYGMMEVDERVTVLTMAADVSANRFIYIVRGWAPDYTSWMLDAGLIFGNTDYPNAWRDLQEYIDEADFGGMPLRRIAVDAGYRPNNTYEFARLNRGIVHPVMGSNNQKKLYATKPVDVDIRGKVVKHGATLGVFNSNVAKDFVHSHIMYEQSEPGALMVPRDVPENYFNEILAEYKMTKPSGEVVFKQLRKDNHYLDCEAMNYVMAYSAGIRRRRSRRGPIAEPVPQQQDSSPLVQPGSDWGQGIGGGW